LKCGDAVVGCLGGREARCSKQITKKKKIAKELEGARGITDL
jgi:hypothetical protein